MVLGHHSAKRHGQDCAAEANRKHHAADGHGAHDSSFPSCVSSHTLAADGTAADDRQSRHVAELRKVKQGGHFPSPRTGRSCSAAGASGTLSSNWLRTTPAGLALASFLIGFWTSTYIKRPSQPNKERRG